MADRFVRPAIAALLALAGIASPALAHTRHHAAATHHAKASKHGSHSTPAKKKPVEHRSPAPAGATNVPAGGLKIFCPAHTSPLLIRKSTQGSGTTVTVVCR